MVGVLLRKTNRAGSRRPERTRGGIVAEIVLKCKKYGVKGTRHIPLALIIFEICCQNDRSQEKMATIYPRQ